jgi:hypothetical protein
MIRYKESEEYENDCKFWAERWSKNFKSGSINLNLEFFGHSFSSSMSWCGLKKNYEEIIQDIFKFMPQFNYIIEYSSNGFTVQYSKKEQD